MGNAWEDGDSPDTATSESLYLPNEGGAGKAEMTGKAGDGLRLALAIYNEKRGDKMRRRNSSLREKPADSRIPSETSGTDGNIERFFLLHGKQTLLE